MANSPLTRQKLAQVFKSPELVRAFDELFRTAADVQTLQDQIDAQAVVINNLNAVVLQLQAELQTARRTSVQPTQQQLDELQALYLAS